MENVANGRRSLRLRPWRVSTRMTRISDLYARYVETVDSLPQPDYERDAMVKVLGVNLHGSIDGAPLGLASWLGKNPKHYPSFNMNGHYESGTRGRPVAKCIARIINRGLFAEIIGPLRARHDGELVARSGMAGRLVTEPQLKDKNWAADDHISGPTLVQPMNANQLKPVFESEQATAKRENSRRKLVPPVHGFVRHQWERRCKAWG